MYIHKSAASLWSAPKESSATRGKYSSKRNWDGPWVTKCSPIFTYGGQATTKPGVQPDEHAIAYSQSRQPMLVNNEEPLINQPICIVDAPGVGPLHLASRIYFGIHHPIQYNVKVKDLGQVHDDYIQRLRGYWNMVNRDATNQDQDVTAAAAQEDGYEVVKM
jgi:hypothetical protein